MVPRQRPAWHIMAPTFESKLPLSFCPDGLKCDPADLTSSSTPTRKPGQPALVCAFCEKIKSYSSIIPLWSHLVHFHTGVERSMLLEEILRTGLSWKKYVELRKETIRDAETMQKIQQTREENFNWEVVVGWKLRK